MLDALIFDFDGLILDTETPLFDAWRRTYEHHGIEPIGLDEWSESLGRADDDPALIDPIERLVAELGGTIDVEAVQSMRRRLRDEALHATPIQPGVMELLDEATRRGLAVAIASSSPPEWIERHLDDRGLGHRFPVRACAGSGVPGKPNPAVYLQAANALEVDPTACLALEDSPNGVRAAKAAGMRCIAVPTAVSERLDLSAADRVVPSLRSVDLEEWG